MYGDMISGQDQLVGDVLVGQDQLVGDGGPWTAMHNYGGDVMHSGGMLISGDDPYANYGADDAAAMLSMSGAARHPHRGHQNPILARLAAAQQQRAHFNHAAHQLAMHRGQPMVVRESQPDRKLKLPAGFNALAVAAGATVPIIVRPQCLFRADELVIPELFAQFFVLSEMSIGQTRLIVGGSPVTALAFSEKSLRPLKLDWPTNQITQEILMTATNISAAPKDLYGIFYGRAAF